MIQEVLVGVQWTCQRGRLASQSRYGLVMGAAQFSMTSWTLRSERALSSTWSSNILTSLERCFRQQRPNTAAGTAVTFEDLARHIYPAELACIGAGVSAARARSVVDAADPAYQGRSHRGLRPEND
jgi:hypothetical protein